MATESSFLNASDHNYDEDHYNADSKNSTFDANGVTLIAFECLMDLFSQLNITNTLEECRISDNGTLEACLPLRGGADSGKLSAAKRAELEHERRERKRISDENYARWFACADRTQPGASGDDAAMRLVIAARIFPSRPYPSDSNCVAFHLPEQLCVSNALIEDKHAIHGTHWSGPGPNEFDPEAESPFCSEPRPQTYGDDQHGGTGPLRGRCRCSLQAVSPSTAVPRWSRARLRPGNALLSTRTVARGRKTGRGGLRPR